MTAANGDENTATAEYGIVYLLPPPVAAAHRTLVAAIERTFSLTGQESLPVPPHLTLKYRFETADVQPVLEVLADFAASEWPAPWQLAGFSSFQSGEERVIFVDVVPSAAVRAAHARLLERLRALDWMQWQEHDGPDLHYHATLAHLGLTPENFDAVWQYLNEQEPLAFDLALDNVTLLLIDGENHAVHTRFELAGGDR